MERTVKCVKLGKELPGMKHPPFKGALGQRVFESVSQEGWKLWLKHSTMVINEYRLNPAEPKAQTILFEHLEKFFFGEGVETPPDYQPLQH